MHIRGCWDDDDELTQSSELEMDGSIFRVNDVSLSNDEQMMKTRLENFQVDSE